MREANIGREVTEQIHVLFGSSLIGEVLQSVFVGEFEQQFIELLYFDKCLIILSIKGGTFFFHEVHIKNQTKKIFFFLIPTKLFNYNRE